MQAKNNILYICLVLFAGSVICPGCGSGTAGRKWESSSDLVFEDLAGRWDEGIPLGNGVLGAIIWRRNGRLRMALDRIDLWDLRLQKEMHGPAHTFNVLYTLWKTGCYEEARKFRDFLRYYPYPTKIPGAALEFDLESLGEIESVRLLLRPALCEIRWKKGAIFQAYIHSAKKVGFFRFSKLREQAVPILVPPDYTKGQKEPDAVDQSRGSLIRLEYPEPEIESGNNSFFYRQKTSLENYYEVFVGWKKHGKTELSGVWTVASNIGNPEADTIRKTAEESLRRGFSAGLKEHIDWWKEWWERSRIRVPDETLQAHWEREVYKFGSCTGKGEVPISLQSVWTADNGQLPPWAGDFHHDLNTQLSYWPSYTANRLDAGRCFVDWLWKVKPEAEAYTRRFFESNGLSFPGVTDILGRAMGGWWQYSHNPTVAAWLGQHFYWQWRYSMDRDFLADRAYPWIREAAEFFTDFSSFNSSGMRNLPLSSSPEINDDAHDAWFSETTNFDLAFIRWTYIKAAEMALELGKLDEAEKWNKILNEWPPLRASEDNRLLIAPSYALPYSHRHFSHLVAIHPLGLVDIMNGSEDQAIISASLDELDRMGTDLWVGYSFSWLANLKARAADGEGAAGALLTFVRAFCSPNTFHLNGDQTKSGYSRYTYRPFTLEGNFAWMSGLLEMLLQSHNGMIRIFPAVPPSWKDISFSDLRAQGAFLISAEMKDGKIKGVRCLSEKGGRMCLLNPFAEIPFTVEGIDPSRVLLEGSVLSIDCRPGEVFTLKTS